MNIIIKIYNLIPFRQKSALSTVLSFLKKNFYSQMCVWSFDVLPPIICHLPYSNCDKWRGKCFLINYWGTCRYLVDECMYVETENYLIWFTGRQIIFTRQNKTEKMFATNKKNIYKAYIYIWERKMDWQFGTLFCDR